MFTSCPECHRQYRIHAQQLGAAQGMARCGFCGKKFNALQRLTDIPVRLQIVTPKQQPQEPALDGRPETELDDSFEPQFDIPEILETEEPAPMRPVVRVLWSSTVLLLTLVLVSQLGWFNRDYLLERYPQFKPWAKQLCERANCRVIRQFSTADIHLLNRDVRLHPRYADTLLVNATMANQSHTIQPFPGIQLSLFDTNGKIIASRTFRPEEYLDNSIQIDEGMAVDQPVHFVLEVTGPTRGAVSFEFRFL